MRPEPRSGASAAVEQVDPGRGAPRRGEQPGWPSRDPLCATALVSWAPPEASTVSDRPSAGPVIEFVPQRRTEPAGSAGVTRPDVTAGLQIPRRTGVIGPSIGHGVRLVPVSPVART